jgi:hypothetical protein
VAQAPNHLPAILLIGLWGANDIYTSYTDNSSNREAITIPTKKTPIEQLKSNVSHLKKSGDGGPTNTPCRATKNSPHTAKNRETMKLSSAAVDIEKDCKGDKDSKPGCESPDIS